MIRAIKNFISELKWQRLIAPYKRKIAEAKKRGDTRAIGKATRELRDFAHTSIGWRGRGH